MQRQKSFTDMTCIALFHIVGHKLIVWFSNHFHNKGLQHTFICANNSIACSRRKHVFRTLTYIPFFATFLRSLNNVHFQILQKCFWQRARASQWDVHEFKVPLKTVSIILASLASNDLEFPHSIYLCKAS